MILKLFKELRLAGDLPEHGLHRGDIIKLVDHHIALDGGEGYSIEVFNAVNKTTTVTTVPISALKVLK